jgi:hypothetical protein
LRTLVQSSPSSAMASSSCSIVATTIAATGGTTVVAVSHQHQQQQQRTLRGVVFDMDGTLTVPTIDFASMYSRVLGDDHLRIVSGSPINILHEIAEWSPNLLALTVATPLWPSVGVKPNTWKSWRFGVLRDFQMFRAR